jgi:glucose/arabinose dehydrogenase
MKRLWTLFFLAATAAAQPLLELRPVVGSLDHPVAITHAGDTRLFITLQTGTIVIWDGTRILPDPFLDIRTLVQNSGERGLLSTAFHPSYRQNGRFFVFYTDHTGDLRIVGYRVSANDPNRADTSTAAPILTVPHREFAHHNGGQMQFGPDGYLYISTGDGGSSGDPNNRAQNLNDLLGKILRIDVDSATPYASPATNPFSQTPNTRSEIWAYGLRNPWRFSFDRLTGDLWTADVGQNSWEEIDLQSAGHPGGENYGWRLMEGTHCFNPATNCNPGGLKLPVIEYGRINGRCSVTGGYRARGARFPRFAGTYFYGDYCSGEILGARVNPDSSWTSTLMLDTELFFGTFGEDSAGQLYAADREGGGLYLLADAGGTARGDMNRDENVDVLWRNTVTGENAVWFLDRTAFRGGVLLASASLDWTLAGAADFNNDGSTDLVWRNPGTGANAVWFMSGTTLVSSANLPSTADLGWNIEAVGDFNGDQVPDLFWHHHGRGATAIWLMTPSMTRLASVDLPAVGDANWHAAAAADFDSDGDPDLVWRHATNGSVVFWRMNGTTLQNGVDLGNLPDNQWKIVAAGDYSGDRKADLFWHHAGTGANAAWFIDRFALTGSSMVDGLSDLRWVGAGPR